MDLLITSNMAASYLSLRHDPANFTIQLPNNSMTSKVVKCVPKLITIPRLFENITQGNNEVIFVQPGPVDTYYRVVIPPGLYTTAKFIEVFNEQVPPTLQITVDPDRLIRMVPLFYATPTAATTARAYVPAGSEFAKYLGWRNLSTVPTILFGVAPQESNAGLTLPQLGGPQSVNVTLRCVGPQQINAKDGCETETLAVVDMDCPVGETAIFRSQDTFVNDIDHMSQPRNYSTLDVRVLDAWTNRPLSLPNVCTVSILLKLYHVDTQRE
jgi:hypothetical protein